MCELLGMSFNLPVNPKISFKGFQIRGKDNPDGWGIAYYEREHAIIKKEAKSALSSDFLNNEDNLKNINSKIIIGHVRKKSRGESSHNNTHPFQRVLSGKEYLFAHNGTIKDFHDFDLSIFKPCGETDSEHIFCYLLECIKKKNIMNWTNSEFEWLYKQFYQINNHPNSKFNKFNCLMSDGEHLFCYHDMEELQDCRNTLYYIQRKLPYGNIKLKDIDWDVDLRKEKNSNHIGFIIATKPLTDEKNWEAFIKGELIVFKDGKRIYSSQKRQNPI